MDVGCLQLLHNVFNTIIFSLFGASESPLLKMGELADLTVWIVREVRDEMFWALSLEEEVGL